MPIGSHAKRNDRHNLISVVSGELVWLEAGGVNPPDVLVASEYAPAFAVDLPLAQHRMRLAALPFAVEDWVAQPLEDLHVVLGSQIGPRRYLAAVVAKARMAALQAMLSAKRITPRRIVPDATTLSVPQAPAEWAVRVEGERVLVRTRTHDAFATSVNLVEALWIAAGRPALERVGDAWVAALPEPTATSEAPLTIAEGRGAVDLQQRSLTDPGERFAGPLKIAAVILVCAAAAHTALVALDTVFVSNAVANRKAEASRLLAAVTPLARPGEDPASVLAAMLPTSPDAGGASRFLPMLSRIASTISPVTAGISLQALSYDEADGAMVLKVEASDLPALERVQRILADAGFATESGGASVSDGRAESSFSVRDSAAVVGGDAG